MIIKMKNGTHIHMLNLKFFLHFFGDQTTNETTWNPRKYWFPFIIQKKWRFSLSHLCFSLFEWDTLVVYIRYTWKSTNSFFFHRCDVKKKSSRLLLFVSLSLISCRWLNTFYFIFLHSHFGSGKKGLLKEHERQAQQRVNHFILRYAQWCSVECVNYVGGWNCRLHDQNSLCAMIRIKCKKHVVWAFF